jgi:hypothetical protein
MSFAGYVAVCVQLYCVSCHCLTLYVHLQVCSIFLFTYVWRNLLRWFLLPFFARGHTARLHLCFSVLFSFVNFVVVSCVYVCLLAFSFVVCLYIVLWTTLFLFETGFHTERIRLVGTQSDVNARQVQIIFIYVTNSAANIMSENWTEAEKYYSTQLRAIRGAFERVLSKLSFQEIA